MTQVVILFLFLNKNIKYIPLIFSHFLILSDTRCKYVLLLSSVISLRFTFSLLCGIFCIQFLRVILDPFSYNLHLCKKKIYYCIYNLCINLIWNKFFYLEKFIKLSLKKERNCGYIAWCNSINWCYECTLYNIIIFGAFSQT